MKTKEISFDVIQKVKANNKLFEQLDQMSKIADNIYFNDLQLQELSVNGIMQYFKDIEEEDFCSSDFVYLIIQFCQKNQRLLMNNSKELI